VDSFASIIPATYDWTLGQATLVIELCTASRICDCHKALLAIFSMWLFNPMASLGNGVGSHLSPID
jgi:hypothetical protein